MYKYHPNTPLSSSSNPSKIAFFRDKNLFRGEQQHVWDQETITAREAALEAGELLLDLFGKGTSARKKGEIDLVTDADIRSEKAILGRIRERFPDDSILSEESGRLVRRPGRVWIVDPLDGTTNFAHSFPLFAVSIGLEVEHELVLGVVFNPVLNERYEAVRGGGAFLNGNPIAVSGVATLMDALLATGFPYTIHEDPERTLLHFRRMITRAQGIRRPGAAALDLCFVAAGCMDGFWEEGLKPWDSAAGALILEEAGGKLTTYAGNPFSPYEDTVVASNSLIHEAMLLALRGEPPQSSIPFHPVISPSKQSGA
jgi:myo-inositol-1(or 4)-monophosphatase